MSGKPMRMIAAARLPLILFAAAAFLFCLARPSRIFAAEPQTAAQNPSGAGAQASPPAADEPQTVPPARSQDQNAARNPYRPAAVLSAADVVFPFKTTADAAVIFSVSVGPGGQAGKITVLQDVPPFTAAAEESLKSWKFSAASFEGRAEDSEIPVAFVFRHAVYIANPPLFTPAIPAKESGRSFVPAGIVSIAYAGYPASTIAFGAVVVQANVKPDGSIGAVSIARDLAGGFGPLAVDAAKHWKFQAASRDGRPVPGKVAIAFVFSSRSLNPF